MHTHYTGIHTCTERRGWKKRESRERVKSRERRGEWREVSRCPEFFPTNFPPELATRHRNTPSHHQKYHPRPKPAKTGWTRSLFVDSGDNPSKIATIQGLNGNNRPLQPNSGGNLSKPAGNEWNRASLHGIGYDYCSGRDFDSGLREFVGICRSRFGTRLSSKLLFGGFWYSIIITSKEILFEVHFLSHSQLILIIWYFVW